MVTPEHKLDYNLIHRCVEYFRDKTPYPTYDKSDPLTKTGTDFRHDHSILAGMIKTPFGDLWDNLISFQGNGFCGELEFRMMNCLEAYGLPQSYKKCKDYIDDFLECSSTHFQEKRMILMRDERRRQWKEGEREIKYAVPPKLWSYSFFT